MAVSKQKTRPKNVEKRNYTLEVTRGFEDTKRSFGSSSRQPIILIPSTQAIPKRRIPDKYRVKRYSHYGWDRSQALYNNIKQKSGYSSANGLLMEYLKQTKSKTLQAKASKSAGNTNAKKSSSVTKKKSKTANAKKDHSKKGSGSKSKKHVNKNKFENVELASPHSSKRKLSKSPSRSPKRKQPIPFSDFYNEDITSVSKNEENPPKKKSSELAQNVDSSRFKTASDQSIVSSTFQAFNFRSDIKFKSPSPFEPKDIVLAFEKEILNFRQKVQQLNLSNYFTQKHKGNESYFLPANDILSKEDHFENFKNIQNSKNMDIIYDNFSRDPKETHFAESVTEVCSVESCVNTINQNLLEYLKNKVNNLKESHQVDFRGMKKDLLVSIFSRLISSVSQQNKSNSDIAIQRAQNLIQHYLKKKVEQANAISSADSKDDVHRLIKNAQHCIDKDFERVQCLMEQKPKS